MKFGFGSVLALVTISTVCFGDDMAAPKLVPAQSIRYWVQEIRDTVGTGGGVTAKSNIPFTLELTALVGEAKADGLVPITLKVTRAQTTMPHWVGFKETQESFDTKTWNGKTPSEMHMLRGVALMRKPIALLMNSRGKIDGVADADNMRTELESMLRKDFSQDPAFTNTVSADARAFAEDALQSIWQVLLVQEFPNDFELDEEWQVKRRYYAGENWTSLEEKHVAKDAGDGAVEIATTVKLPRTEPITIKKKSSVTTYFVKNGTGNGTKIVDRDGWVRKSDSMIHIYLSNTVRFAGTDVPMEFYTKACAAKSYDWTL